MAVHDSVGVGQFATHFALLRPKKKKIERVENVQKKKNAKQNEHFVGKHEDRVPLTP